jgi:hypothetical protein
VRGGCLTAWAVARPWSMFRFLRIGCYMLMAYLSTRSVVRIIRGRGLICGTLSRYLLGRTEKNRGWWFICRCCLWVIAPCSVIGGYRRFGGTYCFLWRRRLRLCSSETLLPTYSYKLQVLDHRRFRMGSLRVEIGTGDLTVSGSAVSSTVMFAGEEYQK